MGRKRLGIYDREAAYARGLGSYIRRRCGGMLEICVFTRLEALEACLEAGGLDVLLTGTETEALCRRYPTVQTVVLSEEKSFTDGQSYIGKYQSAEQIWRQLISGNSDWLSGDAVLSAESGIEIIGICSPFHGIGKTTAGLLISRILAERKRTLFLTLDEFSCFPEMLDTELPEAELSELYYHYSQGNLTGGKIQAAVCRFGAADCIAPVRVPADLYREGKPYEPLFFRQLSELGGYRYLILDMGNSLWGREQIFDMCSGLLIGEPLKKECPHRMDSFLLWLKQLGVEGRSVRYCLPEEKGTVFRQFGGRTGRYLRELLTENGYIKGGEADGAGY